VLCQFAGGAGGQKGATLNTVVISLGGVAPINGASPGRYLEGGQNGSTVQYTIPSAFGAGGPSASGANTSVLGGFDPAVALGAFVGGAAGSIGTDATQLGGQGGGGGGGGAFGNGGAGGAGGNGNAASPGTGGSTPTAPAANTGAGGGGGGAGGSGTSGGAGATGAAGGSAQVTLYWFA
jgi:hypothetical protein